MFGFSKKEISTNTDSQQQLFLVENCLCIDIYFPERDDGYGPYLVGVAVNDKTGSKGRFLIEIKDYSTQESRLLINKYVKLHIRSNGAKLKPLNQQSKEVIKLITDFRNSDQFELNQIDEKYAGKDDKLSDNFVSNEAALRSTEEAPKKETAPIGIELAGNTEDPQTILENLMATATQKCHDFGLPMFIGICLPPKKYKK